MSRERWLKNGGEWHDPKAKPDNWSLEEQARQLPEEYMFVTVKDIINHKQIFKSFLKILEIISTPDYANKAQIIGWKPKSTSFRRLAFTYFDFANSMATFSCVSRIPNQGNI